MTLIQQIIECFKPDMTILTNIGNLVSSHQFEQCAKYIKNCDKNKFKKCIVWNIKDANKKKNEQRLCFSVKLYELVFKDGKHSDKIKNITLEGDMLYYYESLEKVYNE